MPSTLYRACALIVFRVINGSVSIDFIDQLFNMSITKYKAASDAFYSNLMDYYCISATYKSALKVNALSKSQHSFDRYEFGSDGKTGDGSIQYQ